MEPLEKYKNPLEEELVDLPDLEDESSNPFKEICCPSCKERVDADNLNLNHLVAKCNKCHVVFPFSKEIQAFEQVTKKVKQEMLRPEGIELFYYNDELEISFEQPENPLEVLVASALTLFIFFFPFLVFKKALSLMLLGLPILGLLGGILYFMHRKKHKVFVTITNQFLNIFWRPGKLVKDKKYAVQDIRQIYVKPYGLWDLMMIVDQGDGQEHVKLTSVKTLSKAKFLEQEIEKHLGITNVAVLEEYSSPK